MIIKNKIKNILYQTATLILIWLSKSLLFKRKQSIWLILHDGERWGDNANAFWLFMNREHPEIKALAVVKKGCAPNAYKRQWVIRGSLYSYILILQAEVLATTHRFSDFGPDRIVSSSKAKKVWLQHGIIAIGKNLIGSNAKSDRGIDLICASSSKEKKRLINDFGVMPDLVSITGLARHDILKQRIEDKLFRTGVLYVPTSRRWLNEKEKDHYEELLFSWFKLVDKNECNVKLWIHPGWYACGLQDLGSKYRGIKRYGMEFDPQTLICNSRLLITDYSSIFFDAALSGIPTIFYQPDRSMYIERVGLFKEFIDQDLLIVVENDRDLLTQINKLMTDREYYFNRIEKDKQWAYKNVETFDGYSCQRIYQQIINSLRAGIIDSK